MSNTIANIDTHCAYEGVLITYEQRLQHDENERIRLSAERYAKKIVIEAQDHAQDIYCQAYSNGYEAGLKDVFSQLIEFVLDQNQAIQHQYDQLLHQLETTLLELFNQSDFISHLLKEWLTTQEVKNKAKNISSNNKVILVLPLNKQNDHHFLRKFEDKYNGNIKVEYHESEVYLMKYHNQIIEFHPVQAAKELGKAQIDLIKLRMLSQELANNALSDISKYLNEKLNLNSKR